jgi:hypothetical protein
LSSKGGFAGLLYPPPQYRRTMINWAKERNSITKRNIHPVCNN